MKALVYTNYGGPEALRLQDIEKPIPKDNEVLVRVHAVSINDWDWAMLQGDLTNRMLNGLRKPRIQVLGSDIAGTIEAIGKNVTRFRIGDAVYGDLSGRWGGFAEYACAVEKSLAPIPNTMTFAEAAAIPQAGMLAVQGLLDVGKLQEGQKILVNGAGGGVGTFAIQLAKLYHAETTAVDSAEKLAMLQSLGYDDVIDYRSEDFTQGHTQYDLILDTKTNRKLTSYARVLRPGGRYVTVGGDISKLLQILLLSPWIAITRKKYLKIVALKPNKDLEYMNALFTEGKMKPIIDGPFPLEDYAKAWQRFSQAKHQGKIVFTIA